MNQPPASDDANPSSPLARTIEEVAHLLPAQGPISVFIHHNTLHAFEHLPFEQAVELAGEQLGCEPYLPEARYRDKLAAGRIHLAEIDVLLASDLGGSASIDIAGIGPRIALWRAVVLHGIPEAAGRELSWTLEETPALLRFRSDLPVDARPALPLPDEPGDAAEEERRSVGRLWRACLEAAVRAGAPQAPSREPWARHRDWLAQSGGPDTDAWIHPPLIRFLAGYLDQGLTHWAMPTGAFSSSMPRRLRDAAVPGRAGSRTLWPTIVAPGAMPSIRLSIPSRC